MHRLLMLLPLLTACALAANEPSDRLARAFGAFQVGQVWKLSNLSNGNAPVTTPVLFEITKVDNEFHYFDAETFGTDRPYAVLAALDEEVDSINLISYEYKIFSSGKIKNRICLIRGGDTNHNKYYGSGAFIELGEEMKTNSFEAFVYNYKVTHPDSTTLDGYEAHFAAVAPDTFGPCTLERVK